MTQEQAAQKFPAPHCKRPLANIALGPKHPVKEFIDPDIAPLWDEVRDMHEPAVLQAAAIALIDASGVHQAFEICFFSHC
ncbi:hypothetical protein [Rhizobium sp. G21]|uniref:hypothetical protein n=1 Tax=Rhizobium sp. G21 TaxID=2758439 RepID=UPI0015FF78C1|nr:hypothetical protein [Rhizobium sp. G21]MBB1248505.1 hypothetical protein [Rhizobium sp. G21]